MQEFNYEVLLEQCTTDRQREMLSVFIKCGSGHKAGKALGIPQQNVARLLKVLKQRAISKGYSPEHDMVHTVPDGYKVKGVSTYYDKDGNPRG